MRTLYRVGFELGAAKEQAASELVARVIALSREWLTHKVRIQLPNDFMKGLTSAEFNNEKGKVVQTLFADSDGERAWGMTLVHGDRLDPELIWQAELTVYQENEGRPYFGCSLLVGRHSETVAPLEYDASRPEIVSKILEKIGGRSYFPLLTKAASIKNSKKDVDMLLDGLLSSHRTHPIVFVSIERAKRHPMVDVRKLAAHLGGLAIIVVPESIEAEERFRALVPQNLGVEDGAVAVYWPGFRLEHRPHRHLFWSREAIVDCQTKSRMDFTSKLLTQLANASLHRADRRHASWADVERIARRKALHEAKKAGEEAKYAELLWEDNETMGLRLKELEQELTQQKQEVAKYQAIADGYRRSLEEERNKHGASIADLPPETVVEAVEKICSKYADRFVRAFNSKSEHDESSYGDINELVKAMEWLATTYYNAKTGAKSCVDLDRSLRETVPGWSYSPHQSDKSTGQWPEWYQCTWNKKKYDITEHMRHGTGSDPRTTIRVAFAWDREKKKMVLGYIGQHQRNTHS